MNSYLKQKAKAIVMQKGTNFVMVGLIFLAAAFYMYYANTAVRTLTSLENTKEKMQALRVSVSEMESKRLAIENNVSTDRAKLLGFVEVSNPVFVMKNAKRAALSYKTD